MNLYVFLERCEKAGFKTEIIGDDRNSVLVVDGVPYGHVIDDKVYAMNAA